MPADVSQLLREIRAAETPDPTRFHAPPADRAVPPLPHRPPFLLIDRVCHVDADARLIVATRRVSASDPVFSGHYPGRPVYPGTLLVEAMGQAALALLSFFPASDWPHPPSTAMLTRIRDAQFLSPVGPDSDLLIEARLVDVDACRLVAAGRAFAGARLCAIAAVEIFNAVP